MGTKNGFVVTWLTKVNFHGGVFGKFPAVLAADALVLGLALLLDEHAASSADAAAVALTSPVPLSNRRRVGPSCILSVSIASSTLGWTLSITNLRIVACGQNAALRRTGLAAQGLIATSPPSAAGRVIARRRAEAWILVTEVRQLAPSLMAT